MGLSLSAGKNPLEEKNLIPALAILTVAAAAVQAAEGAAPLPDIWGEPGLVNLVTLISLILFGSGSALGVTLGRVLLVSFFEGTFLSPVFYTLLVSGVASAAVMILLYRPLGVLSPVWVGVAGGFSYNLTRLLSVYLQTAVPPSILKQFLLLAAAGAAVGAVNGYLSARGAIVLTRFSPRRIYLGSSSPRRIEIMRKRGVPVIVISPGINEGPPLKGENPADYASRQAEEKLRAIAGYLRPPGILITADTVVECGGRILGKPSGEDEAARMLRYLSGKTQRVFTAVEALNLRTGEKSGRVEVSELKMKDMTPEEVSNLKGRNLDKAGAYGIQSMRDRYVEWVKGSYLNIVGFPVAAVRDLIREVGG